MKSALPACAILLTACASSAAPAPAPIPSPAPAATAPAIPAAQRGLAFAEQHCAACHAVTANGTSPNPESPPFADIANRPGVTAQTLAQFLRDSHNYPEAMNFRVEAERIDDLAAYMLTLRQPGYRPSI